MNNNEIQLLLNKFKNLNDKNENYINEIIQNIKNISDLLEISDNRYIFIQNNGVQIFYNLIMIDDYEIQTYCGSILAFLIEFGFSIYFII